MKPKIEVMIGVQSCTLVGHFFVKGKKMIKRWYVELCTKVRLLCGRHPDKAIDHVFRKARDVADPEIEDIIRTERKK